MEKLESLLSVNQHLLDKSSSDGLYILGGSLETWGPNDEEGFELPEHAKKLMARGRLCVILDDGEYEYCSPARALEWLEGFDWANS